VGAMFLQADIIKKSLTETSQLEEYRSKEAGISTVTFFN